MTTSYFLAWNEDSDSERLENDVKDKDRFLKGEGGKERRRKELNKKKNFSGALSVATPVSAGKPTKYEKKKKNKLKEDKEIWEKRNYFSAFLFAREDDGQTACPGVIPP